MNNLIASFSKMNIDFFNTFSILEYNDEKINNHLHRKMVKYIEEVFNAFKELGDTELKIHDTICGSDVCSDFKTSKFYCFVGNNSKDYCLVQIRLFEGVPGAIKFCSSILKPKGIELGKLIEPYDEYADGLPF